jgi:sugar-phosphatase
MPNDPCLQPARKVKLKGEMIEFTCQAFLFDMDGVLADSTPAVGRVWAQWAREHQLDPEEVVRRAHGRPSLTTIREYLPEGDHLQENREIERRELAGVEEIVTFPGAQQLLASLPQERWAIVTSSTRRLAEARHRATGLPRPRCFITSDDVTRGKPDPQPYLLAAQALGFAIADCVVVEDVGAGIRAGKAAGARVIALQTTASPAELLAAEPDWIVPDCSFLSVSAAPEGLRVELNA